jgi:hypothetical protein
LDRDDLVELRKFAQLHEAEIAVSALGAAQIDAILREASYGGFRPEASIAGGGVTVLVRRDQLDAAREVLDAPVIHDPSDDALTCANCGRSLQGTVCPVCDAEQRETFLTPQNTRASIGKLKLFVLAAALLLMIGPTIIDRLSRFDEKSVLTALAIAAGALLVIVVLKALTTGSDERL